MPGDRKRTVEDQWTSQLESANKAAKSALSALAIFTSVFVLTAITNATDQYQAQGRTARAQKRKEEVDEKIRWAYESWTNDYSPAQTAIVVGRKIEDSVAVHPNPTLTRAFGHLTELEGWYNVITVLKLAPKAGAAKQFEELNSTERGYLCSLILMTMYMNSKAFEPEGQAVNQVLAAPLSIPPIPDSYQFKSADLLQRFGYIGRLQTDEAQADASSGVPISDADGYGTLASEVQDDVKNQAQLKSAAVTFPLINFSVNLTSIGFAGVLANLAIIVYLFIVLERVKAIAGNIGSIPDRDVAANVALVSDFPLIGTDHRVLMFIQAFAITVPAVASIAYYEWTYLSLDHRISDAVMNGYTSSLFFASYFFILYLAWKLKSEAQVVGRNLGVRNCIFSGSRCEHHHCALSSAYCDREPIH